MLGLSQVMQASDSSRPLVQRKSGFRLHPQVGVFSRIIITYMDLIFALQDIYWAKGLKELFLASTGPSNGRPNRFILRTNPLFAISNP